MKTHQKMLNIEFSEEIQSELYQWYLTRRLAAETETDGRIVIFGTIYKFRVLFFCKFLDQPPICPHFSHSPDNHASVNLCHKTQIILWHTHVFVQVFVSVTNYSRTSTEVYSLFYENLFVRSFWSLSHFSFVVRFMHFKTNVPIQSHQL